MTNITINQSIFFLPSWSFMTPCLSCCFWDGNGSSQWILAHSWKVALEVMLPAMGLACKKTSQTPEIWWKHRKTPFRSLEVPWSINIWHMNAYELSRFFGHAYYNCYTVALQTSPNDLIDSLQQNSEALKGDWLYQFSASAIARGAVSSWCSWAKFLWQFLSPSSDPEIIVFYTFFFLVLFCQLGNL